MEPEVNDSNKVKQENCLITNGTIQDCNELNEDEKEPSEENTTDKSGILNTNIHNALNCRETLNSPNDNDNLKEEDERQVNKCLEVKQEPIEMVPSYEIKQDNQDADEEEEVVEKDNDEGDKLDREKSSQDPENQDGSHFDRLSFLGRNRRVRQKNRYFLDFHCIDLTKGARSNKDDYDTFTTASSTRSSNRRSTTDSNRANQDDGPDVFESRYCRKCLSKTPHDFDGGCQACLYKKIVESSKRQKPSSQKNRSGHSKQSHDNEVESSPITTAASSNKRKATKQGGSKNSSSTLTNTINNINNNINNNNTLVNTIQANNIRTTTINNNSNSIDNTTNTTTTINDTATLINNDNNNINIGINKNQDDSNKLPRLDSWTPDEVAEYILSKGFAHEAELFKTQSVDGISLLLMQRTDFTYGLKIKLGPALKIYDQVCKLKKEYFQTITTQ